MSDGQSPSLLRVAREKRGMTLTELANRTGIHISTLSKIENHHRPIHADEVKPIAKVLRCSPSVLLPESETLQVISPADAVPVCVEILPKKDVVHV